RTSSPHLRNRLLSDLSLAIFLNLEEDKLRTPLARGDRQGIDSLRRSSPTPRDSCFAVRLRQPGGQGPFLPKAYKRSRAEAATTRCGRLGARTCRRGLGRSRSRARLQQRPSAGACLGEERNIGNGSRGKRQGKRKGSGRGQGRGRGKRMGQGRSRIKTQQR